MINYPEIILDSIRRSLSHLSWKCQSCPQTMICEDQANGGESRYCWPMIEAAILNKQEWSTEHINSPLDQTFSQVVEAIKIVGKELEEMSMEDFHEELKKHEDGDITKALLELEDFGSWLTEH